MNAAMAARKSKARKPRVKNSNSNISAKKIISEGLSNTGLMMHNSLIALIFGLGMFFASIITMHAAMIFMGLLIGRETGGNLESTADVIITFAVIIMTSGFALHVATKIDGWLFSKMKARFWKRDKATGEIVKPTDNSEE